jgi:hypothetical protein
MDIWTVLPHSLGSEKGISTDNQIEQMLGVLLFLFYLTYVRHFANIGKMVDSIMSALTAYLAVI